MSKKKLSKNQQRQIKFNQQKKLITPESSTQYDEEMALGELQEGIVICRYGKQADIEDQEGHRYRCNIRRTLDSVITGDRVMWREEKTNSTELASGIIEAVHPRASELARPDFYDGVKPIAANIDQVIIVSAVVPTLSFNIIDRYLVASEHLNLDPIIVVNKIDLLSPTEQNELKEQLLPYQQIGYPIIFMSSATQQGLTRLQSQLQGKISIFAGQSGVGKSSLLSVLLPTEPNIGVGEISTTSGLGQHTTTTARLYHLPEGGNIIDSPGIREFGLWHLDADQITRGFREFAPFIGLCRFRDCKHGIDPNCALQHAVDEGKISQARLSSYRHIMDNLQSGHSKKSLNKPKL